MKTILGIGAHPDDLELGCGGTLAALAEAGFRTVMATVSIPSNLERRKEEGRLAAEILGCEVRFLVPDRACRVEDLKTHQLVGMIDDLIKELSPAAVFSHSDPNCHHDHVLVHKAAMASQRLGQFSHFCFAPISVRPVNISFIPTTFFDISNQIDRKMRSIGVHHSQFGERSLSSSHVHEIARHNGSLCGVQYAEGFQVARHKILPEHLAVKGMMEEISRLKIEIETKNYEID